MTATESDDVPPAASGLGGLWWGASSSSLQSEGVAPSADWARWEQRERAPLSSDGNGFSTNYADDFAAITELGLTHVRLTLEWSRLEPEPGRLDQDAFDRYDDILTAAARAGLSVIATLQHGTLPGWFADDTPGFREESGRMREWSSHVDRCAERYDDRVTTWVPIDDPVGWAIRGHLLGSRPPGRRDPELAAEAIEGAILADLQAWNILSSGTTPVMGVFGCPTVFTAGPDAGPRRRWWYDTLFTTWIGALREGELRVPGRPPVVNDDMEGAFDLIGIVHDHPIAVDRSGRLQPYPAGGRRTDAGFTPVPNELVEVLSHVSAELPGRRLVVAGNGFPTRDDEWREELLKEIVPLLVDARAHGVPVDGYLHDTGVDGYEGPLGFSTQRGLLSRGRAVKDSADWLRSRLVGPRASE